MLLSNSGRCSGLYSLKYVFKIKWLGLNHEVILLLCATNGTGEKEFRYII